MSLEDLNRELYKKNSDVILGRTHESSGYDPEVASSVTSPFNKDEAWQKESQEVLQKRKKKKCSYK